MFRRNNLKHLGLAVATLFFFYWVLTLTDPKSGYSSEFSDDFGYSSERIQHGKAKAAFVVLLQDGDLHDFRPTMRQLEDRFNHKYNYPYVLLNDVPFTEKFKKLVSAMTKAKVEYGLIPKEHWSVPESIDTDLLRSRLAKMKADDVIYGGSLSYHHMCRFESGFFFRHHLLDKYDYYWRVEPGVQFYCDLDYDPFMYMQEHDIKYGFTIAMYEFIDTIPTLWDAVKEFSNKYPEYIEKDNLMEYISNDGGKSYNLCHFWSNFEIGSLDFWRGEAYTRFFAFLDEKGGFFYERWGDAPVHSIAASLFLKKHQVHHFYEIGYRHDAYMHCPSSEELQLKCSCNPFESTHLEDSSCTGTFLHLKKKWAEVNSTSG